jgi:membrane protease YdiL (CAAX protease family)
VSAEREKKPRRAEARPPEATPRSGLRAWLSQRHDPLTSLLLTIPVFLLYHLGILLPFVRTRNGVDLVTSATFALLEQSLLGYLALTLGYCAAIAIAVAVLRKRGTIHKSELLPMLGESAILAALMSLTVGWATARLFDWQVGPPAMNPVEKLVMAAGAGFHEELVFRVLLFGGGTFALAKLTPLGERTSAMIVAVVSSLLFSAIHYVGPFGDPFTIVSFGFRFLAGLYLAAVYRFRGFAVAVYTHAIYDVIVFFF